MDSQRLLLHLTDELIRYSLSGNMPTARARPGLIGVRNDWWEIEVLLLSAPGPKGQKLDCEVVNYHAPADEAQLATQEQLGLIISSISFTRLNKKMLHTFMQHKHGSALVSQAPPKLYTEEKAFGIPLTGFTYEKGYVEAKLGDRKYNATIQIHNPHIRPEMRVLAPYFEKILKRKTAHVVVRYEAYPNGKRVYVDATSEQIAAIGPDTLDQLEWRAFDAFRQKEEADGNARLVTVDEYRKGLGFVGVDLSLPDFLTQLLANKNSCHEKELEYLAAQHLTTVMKARLAVQPHVAFLFLVEGSTSYWFVYETFDQQLATYVWRCEKSKAAARSRLAEVEAALSAIRQNNRRSYRAAADADFAFLEHDYQGGNAFATWLRELQTLVNS